jgi:hypothetical protein
VAELTRWAREDGALEGVGVGQMKAILYWPPESFVLPGNGAMEAESEVSTKA